MSTLRRGVGRVGCRCIMKTHGPVAILNRTLPGSEFPDHAPSRGGSGFPVGLTYKVQGHALVGRGHAPCEWARSGRYMFKDFGHDLTPSRGGSGRVPLYNEGLAVATLHRTLFEGGPGRSVV